MEALGQVKRAGFVSDTTIRPPCDSRCTNATGPSCSCPCGGKNHGTGRIVEVDRVGPTPRILILDRADALARAQEWKNEVARIKQHAPGRSEAEQKATGAYLDGVSFGRAIHYGHILERIGHARRLRSHKGRMAALASIVRDEKIN